MAEKQQEHLLIVSSQLPAVLFVFDLGGLMDKDEFSLARTKLNKTQAQMAKLLRTSLKAIQSYEQGWRKIPPHAESQVLLLLALKSQRKGQKNCWVVLKCPRERRYTCPAWEFKAGKLCWFINGTICKGKAQSNWREKIKICRGCEVMTSLLDFD